MLLVIVKTSYENLYVWILTSQVDLMLFSLFSILVTLSENSDWNMKQAILSAKWGISASSNRNCSGLSRGWSGCAVTCVRISDSSSSDALCISKQITNDNLTIVHVMKLQIQESHNFYPTKRFKLPREFNLEDCVPPFNYPNQI